MPLEQQRIAKSKPHQFTYYSVSESGQFKTQPHNRHFFRK